MSKRTGSDFYMRIMVFAAIFFALGLNFLILQPTFPIFNTPNWVWSSIFLILSLINILVVNVWYRRRAVKAILFASIGYLLLLAVGTAQPFIDGVGSLQLPIMYIGLATLITILAVDPPINPKPKEPEPPEES